MEKLMQGQDRSNSFSPTWTPLENKWLFPSLPGKETAVSVICYTCVNKSSCGSCQCCAFYMKKKKRIQSIIETGMCCPMLDLGEFHISDHGPHLYNVV